VAQIRTPIERWLRRLNADDVIATRDAGRPLPTLPLEIDGWQLLYTARPVPPNSAANIRACWAWSRGA
jgi:hypothetical protein